MPRFYVDHAAISSGSRGRTVRITGPLLHHLRDVLRHRLHDTLPLFDKDGRQYRVKIQGITPEAMTAEVLEASLPPPPAVEVTLGVGVVRGPRMDWLIQKATELGVSRLVPLLTRRTVVRAAGETRGRQSQRWQRIALAATQQSEGGRIPIIEPSVTLDAFLQAEDDADLRIIFCEGPDTLEHARPLRTICQDVKATRVVALVGPEGGFAPEEAETAQTRGFVPVTLGRRILRTETAGLIALALLQYELGALE